MVQTVLKLFDGEYQWVEIAGRSGTNWASIELARNQISQEKQIAEPFIDWGMDTVELLRSGSSNPSLNLIGSGGVRNGLDVARCIRLGATVSALAQPFLAPALESTEAVIEKITVLKSNCVGRCFNR